MGKTNLLDEIDIRIAKTFGADAKNAQDWLAEVEGADTTDMSDVRFIPFYISSGVLLAAGLFTVIALIVSAVLKKKDNVGKLQLGWIWSSASLLALSVGGALTTGMSAFMLGSLSYVCIGFFAGCLGLAVFAMISWVCSLRSVPVVVAP